MFESYNGQTQIYFKYIIIKIQHLIVIVFGIHGIRFYSLTLHRIISKVMGWNSNCGPYGHGSFPIFFVLLTLIGYRLTLIAHVLASHIIYVCVCYIYIFF